MDIYTLHAAVSGKYHTNVFKMSIEFKSLHAFENTMKYALKTLVGYEYCKTNSVLYRVLWDDHAMS